MHQQHPELPTLRALTDLDGLANLSSLGGYLSISSNDSLTHLDGLSSLTQVDGDVFINNNPLLCQSVVDALLASCTIIGLVQDITGNNSGC